MDRRGSYTPAAGPWAWEADVTIQDLLVLAIVTCAIAVVARRAWRTLRKAKPSAGSGCGDCGCGHD